MSEGEPSQEGTEGAEKRDISGTLNLADSLSSAVPDRFLPSQDYVKQVLAPALIEGLSWIVKTRPSDPVEALALFLIKNDPAAPELHAEINPSDYE